MEAPSETPSERPEERTSQETALASTSAPTVSVRGLLLAIVCVAVFGELGYTTVNVSAMPVYIHDLRLGDHLVGIAMLAFLVTEGLLKSPFGILGDRFGRKVMMITGPLLSTSTAVLTPHVHSPFALILLRIFDGIGAAALWPSAFSLIGDHVPENRRTAAMSYFNIAYLIGVAVGPFLGGAIDDFARYRLHLQGPSPVRFSFYLASVLFLLTSLIAVLVLPNDHPGAGHAKATSEFDFKAFRAMMRRMPMILLMTRKALKSNSLVALAWPAPG